MGAIGPNKKKCTYFVTDIIKYTNTQTVSFNAYNFFLLCILFYFFLIQIYLMNYLFSVFLPITGFSLAVVKLFIPSKTNTDLNYIKIFSLYRAVNTPHLGYILKKNHSKKLPTTTTQLFDASAKTKEVCVLMRDSRHPPRSR